MCPPATVAGGGIWVPEATLPLVLGRVLAHRGQLSGVAQSFWAGGLLVPGSFSPWLWGRYLGPSSAVHWAGAWLSCDRHPGFSLPYLMGVTGCPGPGTFPVCSTIKNSCIAFGIQLTHICTSIHSLRCSPHCYNVTFGFSDNH